GSFCYTCIQKLSKGSIPPQSLANNMWIGDVPFQIRILSLAERILIARYLPVAYVVKLYPKKRGAKRWSSEVLQNGLKGNVSTHPLANNDIAELMSDVSLPSSLDVLASTIGVTFV
ncbi:hypothetical protein C8J56DRAFT_709063, partial [Mycena floridula]